MTFMLDFLMQACKGSFKNCGPTTIVESLQTRIIDTRDGQMYSVEVKPLGVTLGAEAIDDLLNPEVTELDDDGSLDQFQEKYNVCQMVDCHTVTYGDKYCTLHKPTERTAYHDENAIDDPVDALDASVHPEQGDF